MELMIELINSEPSSFEEAPQHDVWQEAMVEEYDSIMKIRSGRLCRDLKARRW